MILLPYPISTNRMWRNFNNRPVLSPEGRAYKKEAALIAISAGQKILPGFVSMTIILHPKMKKNGRASDTRLDLDNCIKVALDSMNGIMYKDDKQIVRIVAEVGLPMDGGGLSIEAKDL